ncbi:MAG: hypothetical protein SCH71_11695 [Desulfobulbaceae bacterium]|nr:hypothetical protein [Desulfobulbaceae bacterium]
MAEIIKLDPCRTGPKSGARKPGEKKCRHRLVTAYTVFRTVRCDLCGAELDPFDVLVDMLKAYIPDDPDDSEARRLQMEIEKRDGRGRK